MTHAASCTGGPTSFDRSIRPGGIFFVHFMMTWIRIGLARSLYFRKSPPITEIWPLHFEPVVGHSCLSGADVPGPGLTDFSVTATGGALGLLAGSVTICFVGLASVVGP